MKRIIRSDSSQRGQLGINMVDLMMWLVIAALLLAAAIQSIGFYQKNARLYQMKAEADVVASRVMAEFAINGGADSYIIDSIVASENAARSTDNITVSWGISTAAASAAQEPGSDSGMQLVSAVTAVSPSAYFIKVTETNVKNSDVVYFLDSNSEYSSGVHVVAKDALGASSGPPEGAIAIGGNSTCYTGQWKVSYFDAYNFSKAQPLSVNCENGDNIKQFFNLGGAKYLPERVDNFSIRWEKEITIPKSGNYVINGRGDDNIRVYLDDTVVLYAIYSDNTKTTTINIPEGKHKLKVEMTEGVSTGNIEFSYAPAP